MGRACACCTSPRRAEIDSAIVAGATAKAIATTVGLNATQVSRHRRICLQPEVLTESDQVQLWLCRADEMFLQAGVNGQVREQCQALAAGLRALEFSFKRREEIQAQDARALPEDLQKWSDAERSRMLEFLDDIVQNLQLPTPEEYALCYEGEMQQHEHNDLLPYRD